eukprot:gnl/Hemi2/12072_TR4122_c0_g1_i1.p1 gnl/Hemi2/12072_TR4122_c0_g1~~gnl/Hemi2/12072_TR4122_c0_g1_i1.p1  ORF type:complete len:587 (-),score=178.24 gnl/Hemi2/12072_TR4122_c0_g1_i1:149-1909(-)
MNRVFLLQPNTFLGSKLKKLLSQNIDNNVIVANTPEEQVPAALQCDLILLELFENARPAKNIIQALHSAKFTEEKVIITISSAMTWAATKAQSDEDAFFEDDFVKRKPHPLHKDYVTVENMARKAQRDNLRTFNVCHGFLYGEEGGVFSSLLRTAWECDPKGIVCYGDGSSVLPMIHVMDCVNVIVNIQRNKPNSQYVVAVDDGNSRLLEVLQNIAQLGGHPLVLQPVEQLALQSDSEIFQMNLVLRGNRVKDFFGGEQSPWRCEAGFTLNIDTVISEFKAAHSLAAVKAVVIGPAGVGKTHYAELLAKEYKIPHIKIEGIIQQAVINKNAEVASFLDKKERIPEMLLARLVREKLLSRPCQNQGYILDGYPKEMDEARKIFGRETGEDDEESVGPDPSLLPRVLLQLEASDAFLMNRIMNLPESALDGTHNDEQGLLRRLARYRADVQQDDSVIKYFEEHHVELVYADVEDDDVLPALKLHMGEPKNFGPSAEELAAKLAATQAEERSKSERLQLETSERERVEREERDRRLEAEQKRLTQLELQERELLEIRAQPLSTVLDGPRFARFDRGLAGHLQDEARGPH